MTKIRLQKYIAHTGYCSRRKADELISEGNKVTVNGVYAVNGMKVDENDTVEVEGVVLGSNKKKVYIKMNKPAGYTCTSRKFKSEKNVYELLPKDVQEDHSIHIVGRLDKDSQGLILLTNDGELTQELTHPSNEHQKKYIVTLNEKDRDVKYIEKEFLNGMRLDEIGVVIAKKIKYKGGDTFEVILTEGKKRQIRMMFREVGEHVKGLRRVSIGNLTVGGLREGGWEYISKKEIERLL